MPRRTPLLSLLLLLACSTLANATPVSPTPQQRSSSAADASDNVFELALTARTSPHADARLARRYYADDDENDNVSARALYGGGEVSPRFASNLYWSGVMTVAGKSVEMILDTASHNLLLEADVYAPSKASTKLGFRTNLTFIGKPDFQAQVYSDDAVFAKAPLKGVTVSALVGQKPGQIVPREYGQGVLGLSFHRDLPQQPGGVQTPNLLEQLHAQWGVRGFTMDLTAKGGTVRVGDVGAGVEGMVHVDVEGGKEQDNWYVPFTLNGERHTAYLDSGGGRFSVLPVKELKALAKHYGLEVAEVYAGFTNIVADCGTKVDVTFVFGGTAKITIPQDLLWEEVTTDESDYKGKCIMRLVGRETRYTGQWILANLFFQRAVVAFDYAGRRVGIAPK